MCSLLAVIFVQHFHRVIVLQGWPALFTRIVFTAKEKVIILQQTQA
jgi:hypothetical protein